jgi:hypothetical protein
MTDEMVNLRALLEKAPDANFLREMIAFAAERLMELEVGAKTGAAHGECGLSSATAIAAATGRREPGRWTCASPSCARAMPRSRYAWTILSVAACLGMLCGHRPSAESHTPLQPYTPQAVERDVLHEEPRRPDDRVSAKAAARNEIWSHSSLTYFGRLSATTSRPAASEFRRATRWRQSILVEIGGNVIRQVWGPVLAAMLSGAA